jgi:hypothetical protein
VLRFLHRLGKGWRAADEAPKAIAARNGRPLPSAVHRPEEER